MPTVRHPEESKKNGGLPLRHARLRPTTALVKGAIFNILTNGKGFDFQNKRVLDLFAGTGSFGLESLARGAGNVVFVDHAFSCTKDLNHELNGLELAGNVKHEVLCMSVFQAIELLAKRGDSFDLIFLDPPYRESWINPTLERLFTTNVPASDAILVCEHDKREPVSVLPVQWQKDTRRYGDTQLTMITKK